MDSSIMTVIGTLGGVIVGGLLTYFIQKKASERQREWSLQDEARNRRYEAEREQRRIKRELLSKRLEVVEEAIKLRMRIVRREVGRQMGVPTYEDADEVVKMKERIEGISGEAWVSLDAIGSKDLKKYWGQIGKAYWILSEEGGVEDEEWDQAQNAYKKMFAIMDEMKSKG